MRVFILLFAAIMVTTPLQSNPIVLGFRWGWAKSAGGSGNDACEDIAVDPSNNVIATGFFSGTAMFGSMPLDSSGGEDIFVAKIDQNGDWIWAVRAGGTGDDNALGICTDVSGSVYVTGRFEGTAQFGSTLLTSLGEQDMFTAKLDPAGNWLWAVRAGGVGQDSGLGIACGANSICQISGFFSNLSDFGQTILNSAGSTDIFLCALGSDGSWQWATSAGGQGADVGCGNTMDAAGNAYVCGWFQDFALFGDEALTSGGGDDVFVAKYNTLGNWDWCRRAGGLETDRAYGIYTDAEGLSTACGSYQGLADFGAYPTNSIGGSDYWVATISSAGIWAEPNTIGYPVDEFCYDVDRGRGSDFGEYDFDVSFVMNDVNVAGFGMSLGLSNFDWWGHPQYVNWFEPYASTDIEARGLAVISPEWFRFYIGGRFTNSAVFEGFGYNIYHSVISAGGNDVFVASLEFGAVTGGDPVELSSFTATPASQNQVNLLWTTQSETDMLGYRIYRGYTSEQANSMLLTPVLIPATNTSSEHNYSFADNEVEVQQTYYYWLEAVEQTTSQYYGPVSVILEDNSIPELPQTTTMQNPYPNPFRNPGEIKIPVSIREDESGLIRIINLRGQVLQEYDLSEGAHTVLWDGDDSNGNQCGNGIYYVILSTPSAILKSKILMLK